MNGAAFIERARARETSIASAFARPSGSAPGFGASTKTRKPSTIPRDSTRSGAGPSGSDVPMRNFFRRENAQVTDFPFRAFGTEPAQRGRGRKQNVLDALRSR